MSSSKPAIDDAQMAQSEFQISKLQLKEMITAYKSRTFDEDI
jgi:hypothetical protein